MNEITKQCLIDLINSLDANQGPTAKEVAQLIPVDEVADHIELKNVANHIDINDLDVESMVQDTVRNLDLTYTVAEAIDHDAVVCDLSENIDYYNLAEYISVSDVACEFDTSEIADGLDHYAIADRVAQTIDPSTIAEQMIEKVAVAVVSKLAHGSVVEELRTQNEFLREDLKNLQSAYSQLEQHADMLNAKLTTKSSDDLQSEIHEVENELNDLQRHADRVTQSEALAEFGQATERKGD